MLKRDNLVYFNLYYTTFLYIFAPTKRKPSAAETLRKLT